MFVSEKEPPEKPLATDGETIHDRRRPGRVNFRNPWLIALLRGNFKYDASSFVKNDDASTSEGLAPPNTDYNQDPADDLRPAHGIIVSLGLGAGLWVIIGLLGWLCVRMYHLL